MSSLIIVINLRNQSLLFLLFNVIVNSLKLFSNEMIVVVIFVVVVARSRGGEGADVERVFLDGPGRGGLVRKRYRRGRREEAAGELLPLVCRCLCLCYNNNNNSSVKVLKRLSPSSQEVIIDITRRMGQGQL